MTAVFRVVQAPPVAESRAWGAPAMLLPATAGVFGRESADGLAVQRVETVVPAQAERAPAPEAQSRAESTQEDPEAAAHEVHLLASEVWSILKRRLEIEAHRAGRW
jgi:hypothetical protein